MILIKVINIVVKFCIVVFTISSFFNSTYVLGQSQLVEDYAERSLGDLTLSSERQIKYITRSTHKIEKLAMRLRDANNRYLKKFIHLEDALLYSLCEYEEVEIEDRGVTSPESNLLNFEASGLGVLKSDDQKALTSKVINFKNVNHKKGTNADALILDAWYCFNRFENKCIRERNDSPQTYLPELDTISTAVLFIIKTKGVKDTLELNEKKKFDSAAKNLRYELKRSELIHNYISERRSFLNSALASQNISGKDLDRIFRNGYYFNSKIENCKSLFSDRSVIENIVMAWLSKGPQFASFVKLNGALATKGSGVQMKEKLELTDLLENATEDQKSRLGLFRDLKKESSEVLSQQDGMNNSIKQEDENMMSDDKEKSLQKDGSIRNLKETTLGKWKPNPLKTKRIIDRFDCHFNCQLDPNTKFIPSNVKLSGGIGYKYLPNSSFGLAINSMTRLPSIRHGWTDEGTWMGQKNFGIRSFLDVKLRKSIFLQCGYERNYFGTNNLGYQLNMKYAESGMIGLKVVYTSRDKRSKPTLEMLYDLLHNRNGQPAFVIRTGVRINSKHVKY